MNDSFWQRARERLYAKAVFYPTLAWNFFLARVLRRRRWYDRIDPLVIIGAYPFARDVKSLYGDGVRGVVNTCREYDGPVDQYREVGIEQFHMPTVDFTHPIVDDVDRAVEFIDDFVRRGETVYVHCKAGRARSATVVLAWLVRHRGMTPDQAQQHLLSVRPHVNPAIKDRPVIGQLIQRWRQRDAASE